MNKPQVKRVKAWAIVDEKGRIETGDYFGESSCDCCGSQTGTMAIYEKKREAERYRTVGFQSAKYKIIPITLSYPLPSKKPNQKKK